ncbi:MAG TPA: 2'-5' RNA ligase family protein [Dongiaceae bacterium]
MATVIASLAEARAALEAARLGGAAAKLESPPNAASIHGVLWFAELNRALLAEFPDLPFTLTLDCGDRADLAHAALVEGIKRIRFGGHPEAERALTDVAQQLGAAVAARELLYVIAEPELSRTDLDWIQAIRAQHDPQSELVAPHFTLVFGTEAVSPDALVARMQACAERRPPFAFDAQRIDVFEEQYLFLMPDAGARELTSLHDDLRVELGSREVFAPHITVGRVADPKIASRIAERLNKERRVIRGRIVALKAIAVAGRQVHNLATIALKGI